jgi:hypothetical protein
MQKQLNLSGLMTGEYICNNNSCCSCQLLTLGGGRVEIMYDSPNTTTTQARRHNLRDVTEASGA